MKLLIPLKDIMLAPGKRFDPASCSEIDIIERVKQIYGVISDANDFDLFVFHLNPFSQYERDSKC